LPFLANFDLATFNTDKESVIRDLEICEEGAKRLVFPLKLEIPEPKIIAFWKFGQNILLKIDHLK
jgi:hypothetical protein